MPDASCKADVWGYETEPADIFALGICVFILSFQCPPWECARLSNRLFSQYHKSKEGGIESLLKNWNKQHLLSTEALQLLSSMVVSDPVNRPCAKACLEHSWFAEMSERHVQLHAEDSLPLHAAGGA